MITAVLMAIVVAYPDRMPEAELRSRPIPEVWAYVRSLRAERDRTMARIGLEGEENEARRSAGERVLIERVSSRPFKLRPGVYLIHAPNAGLRHLEELHVPD